jgi:rhodanese-related sulfurtransferase
MTSVIQLAPTDLSDMINSGELWLVLDVREPWEINIASVAGTLNIPMADIPDRYDELPADTRIAVLCHSGVRSDRVASWLAAQGIPAVANIVGGIDAWSLEVDSTVPRY